MNTMKQHRQPAGSCSAIPIARRTATPTPGFTLIEVMVAVAILGIILIAVSGLMTGNLQLRRASNRSTEAQQLAASYMEAIKRTWSVLDNYIGRSIDSAGNPVYGPLIMPDPPADPRAAGYTFNVDITCLDLAGSPVDCSVGVTNNPELREVRITVIEPNGTSTGSLVTQIGRPFEPARSK